MVLPVSGVVVFATKFTVPPAQTAVGVTIDTVGFAKIFTLIVEVAEQLFPSETVNV